MTLRLLIPRGPVVLAAAAILAAACGGNQRPVPPCEQGSALLTARTVDGAATIAAVNITGNCQVTSTCIPGVNGPCAMVAILGFSGLPCSFTFVAVDGRSVSATAQVVSSGGQGYQCRDSAGMIHVMGGSQFEPAVIDVDFSTAPPADAGVD